MTDKVQKIREEIEKRLKGEMFLSSDKEYNYLLSFIDSLQEEPVSEELEEATNNYVLNARKCYPRVMDETDRYICNAFKAGANWQKEKDDEEKVLIYKHGFDDCKEYIMKDATEVTVHIDAGNYPYIPQMELYDYDNDIPLAKEGDKYKVILIKEE